MPRWVGRCPECDEWGSVVEEPVRGTASTARVTAVATPALSEHDPDASRRLPTGVDEVDRVLGGGAVPGSVILLAGEPGIGKSTLALQAALSLGRTHRVLLMCGEEAPQQIRARAVRLGTIPDGVSTLDDPSLPAVLGALEGTEPDLVVVDSIQTVFDPEIPSAPGSVAQVRECGARLARAARERGVTIVFVGHVTKEGVVAGPRVLEHLVDVVLQFEGDRSGGVRVLRSLKNRFGSTQEAGFFEMTSDGLVAIRDASRYLLADRCPGLAGSVLAAAVEGRRPFVLEIQALVDDSQVAMPRRTALGVDAARVPVLVAVLNRTLDLGLGRKDVFVSAVGGLRVSEPAADLAVAFAVLSAHLGVPLPDDLVTFGEVGLTGEVRQVHAADRRLTEAAAIGCRRAALPANTRGVPEGFDVIPIRRLADARIAIENWSRRTG